MQIIITEVLYHMQKTNELVTRYAGHLLSYLFVTYMTEIVAQGGRYKIYEGFLTCISAEFCLSFSLAVDVWLCPVIMLVSHSYTF